MVLFANDERVLCYHGSCIYEAKCLENKITRDNYTAYLIHYIGWSKNWDEWVPESRILKYNSANLQLQKKLSNVHNGQLVKSIRKNSSDDENEKEKKDVNKQDYVCTTCIIPFPSQTDLDEHWQWHIRQLEYMQSCSVQLERLKIFKCDLCTSCFLEEAKLSAHTNVHFVKRIKVEVNKTQQQISCVETSPSQTVLGTFQLKHKADIIMKESQKNKVCENISKTNEIDKNEINKMDQNKTSKIAQNELIQLDELVTSQINKHGTIQMDEIITSQIIKQNTIQMDEIVTSQINKQDTIQMDELVASQFIKQDTIQMDEIVTSQINKQDTIQMDEIVTSQINKQDTIQTDEVVTSQIIKQDTIQMNDMKTSQIDGNDIFQMDECVRNKMTETTMNKVDENEPNKLDEQDTNKIDQNETREKYSCTKCTEQFHDETHLAKHKQWHIMQQKNMQRCHVLLDRVKIYKCDFCTNCFLDEAKLKVHQKKYFKRDISTSQSDNNQTEKPYKCETCGWRFLKLDTLKAHNILHQPFPHVCECGIGYYQKSDLLAHRRLVHANYKPPKSPSPEYKLKPEIKPKLESESESENEPEPAQWTPHSRLGPRLKATLTYKKRKNKTNKLKRIKREKKEKASNIIISDLKTQLKTDENGRYVCTICTRTFAKVDHFSKHLYNDHSGKASVANKYNCHVCKKTLSCSGIRSHLLTHIGVKLFVCHICNGRFSQQGALQLHLLRHDGDRKFQCTMCDKMFYNTGALRLHMRVHTGEQPYECKRCWKCFSDPSAYKRHLLIHTGLKPYKCQICPKAFCDPAALFRHKRMHQGFKVVCSICNRTFKSNTALKYHTKCVHGTLRDEDKFECDFCGIKCAVKGNLVVHMKTHINPAPAVECEICLKKLASNYSLKMHVKLIHLKITKKYECDACGSRFLHNCTLRAHKRIHMPKYMRGSYECDYCQMIFHSRCAIIKHITYRHLKITCQICKKFFTSYLGLKKHKAEGCRRCSVCNKAFKHMSTLEDHFIVAHTHKDERKMYECQYCAMAFPLRSRLRQHIRVHFPPAESFRCDRCSAEFSSKPAVQNHIWDKHMLSLYCNICMNRFYSESEFLQHKRAASCRSREVTCEICDRKVLHMKEHLLCHGPKRIECDMCGAKFAYKPSLVRHIKLVHKPT